MDKAASRIRLRAQAPSNGFLSSFVPFYFLSFLMLIYSFITDYQAFNLRYKDNTTRDKNETKVGKQSANLGKNNEPIQNRLSFLIDCKSVILHHLTILSFPMVRPAWDNWWLLVVIFQNRTRKSRSMTRLISCGSSHFSSVSLMLSI